ncbi:MAG: GTP-binding protein [Prolixibacteraceae bacterium]|nr:GTP-binding protein [Prolixibacteraceae bacterium]
MQKIPFHIISGFLGSGKTTFLKRIINQYDSNQKIGIIQNEFAPANIDGVELKKNGHNFHLLEINNGSVFCVCLMGNFARALEKFINEHQPEILIIETSGLSDTTSISEVISSGKLAEKIYIASNWCIIDAQNFAKAGLMKERVVNQLRMADIVLINKADLITEGLDNLIQQIKQINPFAEIKTTSYCNIDFELGNTARNKIYFDDLKTLARPDVNSMVIRTAKKVSKNALTDFLNDYSPKAYRIKGFINCSDGKTWAVQCTTTNVELVLADNAYHTTELIAISDQFTLKEWYQAFKKLH